MREALEELGPEAVSIIRRAKIFKVSNFQRADEIGEIYATLLNSEFLRKIRLGPDSGGIRLTKPEEIKNALDLSKFKMGIKDYKSLAVFPDMKRTIKSAFRILGVR